MPDQAKQAVFLLLCFCLFFREDRLSSGGGRDGGLLWLERGGHPSALEVNTGSVTIDKLELRRLSPQESSDCWSSTYLPFTNIINTFVRSWNHADVFFTRIKYQVDWMKEFYLSNRSCHKDDFSYFYHYLCISPLLWEWQLFLRSPPAWGQITACLSAPCCRMNPPSSRKHAIPIFINLSAPSLKAPLPF